MPIRTKVNCYLCGADGTPGQMAVMGSPAIGPIVDFALCATWLCPSPCFDKVRNSPRISGRIYSEHAAKQREYKANLQAALQETESNHLNLATLPNGLRLTESDIERLAALDGDYSLEKLQDRKTIEVAFRLLRNHKQLPYYHSANGKGEIWDYEELRTRLENLARGNNG